MMNNLNVWAKVSVKYIYQTLLFYVFTMAISYPFLFISKLQTLPWYSKFISKCRGTSYLNLSIFQLVNEILRCQRWYSFPFKLMTFDSKDCDNLWTIFIHLNISSLKSDIFHVLKLEIIYYRYLKSFEMVQ